MNPYRNKTALVNTLLAMRDEKYRAFQAPLVPGATNLLGVRTSDLRILAKTVSEAGAEDFLAHYPLAPDSRHEEKMLYGLICATAKLPADVRRTYLTRFLPLIDNWAVCDAVANSMKFLKKEAADWKDFVFALAQGGTWDKRFFAVCTMLFYGDAAYIDEVLQTYRAMSGDYYVNMGVAWALATLYLSWKDKVLPLLQGGALDDDVVYKTIGKLCDSYRVSDDDKAMLRRLRAEMRQKEKAAKGAPHA